MNKMLYLSESINDTKLREKIVYEYFKTILGKREGDLVEKIDNICTNFLENYYKKILGENWRALIEKYNLPVSNIPVIDEKQPRLDTVLISLRTRFFGNGRCFVLNWISSGSYPRLENIDLTKEFSKMHSRKVVISLLLERVELENEIIKDFQNKKILHIENYLPGIKTFEDLSKKFPDIFDNWIQFLLGEYDQVKIISVQEEINQLKTFMI